MKGWAPLSTLRSVGRTGSRSTAWPRTLRRERLRLCRDQLAGTDSRVSRNKKRPTTTCEGCPGDSVNRYSRDSRCCCRGFRCPQQSNMIVQMAEIVWQLVHPASGLVPRDLVPRGLVPRKYITPVPAAYARTSGEVFSPLRLECRVCRLYITPAPAVHATPAPTWSALPRVCAAPELRRGVHCACARSVRSTSIPS